MSSLESSLGAQQGGNHSTVVPGRLSWKHRGQTSFSTPSCRWGTAHLLPQKGDNTDSNSILLLGTGWYSAGVKEADFKVAGAAWVGNGMAQCEIKPRGSVTSESSFETISSGAWLMESSCRGDVRAMSTRVRISFKTTSQRLGLLRTFLYL